MVRLTRIYTRTGDTGETALGDGSRVPKTDPRVESYGTVDEANSAIGVAVVACRMDAASSPVDDRALLTRIADVLEGVQHDLFDLGADLCTPIPEGETATARLRITPEQVTRLEGLIDGFNEPLADLTSFVLPGGRAGAASLHVARTVVRRAERLAVALAVVQPVNMEAIRYLNRLSDLLFVVSRAANGNGRGDVLWKPGTNR